MEARVRRFRKQVRLENRGRSGIRRRYSRSLRAEAVAYLGERMKGGRECGGRLHRSSG